MKFSFNIIVFRKSYLSIYINVLIVFFKFSINVLVQKKPKQTENKLQNVVSLRCSILMSSWRGRGIDPAAATGALRTLDIRSPSPSNRGSRP